MPKLSIIIPCKNEEEHLPKLLASIKRQTFTDYEVIVADFSTDRTKEVAASYGARVIQRDRPGPGPGRNQGAEHAQGELLLFLDADVILESDRYLEDVVSEFERRHADLATCNVKPDSSRILDRVLHAIYNAFVVSTERIHPHTPGFCMLVRNDLHKGIGGFDERIVYAEDLDYALRVFRRGHKVRVLKSHPILTSVRRLERDGRLGTMRKYLYTKWHMIRNKGPFTRLPFEYEMGGMKKAEKPPSKASKSL
jgi:glycosyltransferase involved in cell wall biosynthesis